MLALHKRAALVERPSAICHRPYLCVGLCRWLTRREKKEPCASERASEVTFARSSVGESATACTLLLGSVRAESSTCLIHSARLIFARARGYLQFKARLVVARLTSSWPPKVSFRLVENAFEKESKFVVA